MNRVLLCGTSSGCGKTTITCAIIRAFLARGKQLAAFKCGPDYIDPVFHRGALGLASVNLDPFFCDEQGLISQLVRYAGKDLSILEGAMGYYDGIAATHEASAFSVAQHTKTPAVLVVDAKGAGNSLGAVLQGFLQYREHNGIKGVIFNRCSPSYYPDLAAIARGVGAIPLGFLPNDAALAIGSRHLGLMMADEIKDLEQKLQRLESLAEQYIDLNAIERIAGEAPRVCAAQRSEQEITCPAHIAVAKDAAFCFLYQENLDLLHSLGAHISYFSPLNDDALPKGAQAVYLPGGYPELHARQLGENEPMKRALREMVRKGMPFIAECGGFLYLHEQLCGVPLVNAVDARAHRTDRLVRFGYITMTAKYDNLILKRGESIRAHEFHYCESSDPGDGFCVQKAGRDIVYQAVHAQETSYAGFPHLYFLANQSAARNFLRRASQYEERT